MNYDSPWFMVSFVGIAVAVKLLAVTCLPRRSALGANIREIADSLIVALLLVFGIVRPFVAEARVIPSSSMKPTLDGDERYPFYRNDRVMVNKLVYRWSHPRRGEIVVFNPPRRVSDKKDPMVKRVVGVAGDRLAIRDHQLYRNGQPVEEPYILQPMSEAFWPPDGTEKVVSPGHLFVMGDNRNNSYDARKWTIPPNDLAPDAHHVYFLPEANVLGRAEFIFWPPNHVRLLRPR